MATCPLKVWLCNFSAAGTVATVQVTPTCERGWVIQPAFLIPKMKRTSLTQQGIFPTFPQQGIPCWGTCCEAQPRFEIRAKCIESVFGVFESALVKERSIGPLCTAQLACEIFKRRSSFKHRLPLVGTAVPRKGEICKWSQGHSCGPRSNVWL